MAGKKRRRSRRRGGGDRSITASDKRTMGAGAVIGYLQGQTASFAALPAAVQPDTAKGKLLGGVALYAIGKYVVKSKYVTAGAKALLTIGAYEAGKEGFSISGDGVGWDDAQLVDSVSGEV